jgi:glutamine phosphoribosylpyrophosphate amidotransferase
MCRMIAAVGDLELGSLMGALRKMASNENPAHTHERRPLGAEFRHQDGWGAAWIENGRFRRLRSEKSCLTDPLVAELAGVRTDLVILHARMASREGSVRIENTHPFLTERGGEAWVFCHNGIVNDTSVLRPPSDLDAEGDMDSEQLFHHILGAYDPADPAKSILRGLEPIRDYTSLHSFLASTEAIHAIAKRHMDQGLLAYHALWEGRGPGIRAVSSEPLDGIRCKNWSRISEPDVRILRRPA